MVSQPPPTEVGLVFESLEASSRVAQLEAEIAQLKDALARAADRSGDRAGGPALGPSPRAGLVIGWYASPKTAIVKVATSLRPSSTRTAVDSAQQRSKLSVIEMHIPGGARLVGAQWTGSNPPAKVRSDRGSTRPCA